jgi:hypothetical protein
MRLIVLLSALLLFACVQATPKARQATPKTAKACFAPSGTYASFAVLKRHDCETAPPSRIQGAEEAVAPNSIKCGLYRTVERFDGHPTVMLFGVAPNGMAGSMTIFLPGCRASYKVVFLRQQGQQRKESQP